MSRPEHYAETDPCDRCGLPALRHRTRVRVRTKYHRKYNRTRHQIKPQRRDRIIGIDGEGQGRRPHVYNFLAGVDEKGNEWTTSRKEGITTKRALDFLLSLPDRALVFGFALGYDQTKWLADLSNRSLYELFHEETRQFVRNGRVLYHPVRWRGYRLNYCNRRLSISLHGRSVAVWDIFAFFQAKFTKAIADWKVASAEEIAFIESMKVQRSKLDQLPAEQVEAYCKSECLNLAKLGRKLLDAHKDVGLPLATFYGAGSTASAFLKTISIRRKRGTFPEGMRNAIAAAFFGGRFENSWIGPILGKVYNNDISSAYPYQTTFLPCLEHGRWENRTKCSIREIEQSQLALCRWRIPKSTQQKSVAWGPLPVRSSIGTIAFPSGAYGGWCWKQEYLTARKLADVELIEAWLYHTDCDCAPFASVPQYYLERLRLGKEAQGIVLKLGLNSIYGKLAQSKGVNPPFQSWIWAGNITSGTRAQLLEALLHVRNPWDILTFATDGIQSRVPLDLPKPADTGTDIEVDSTDEDGKPIKVRKPLGGWEAKEYPKGIFCVRPGIYFPLEPTEKEIEKVRARGLGRRVLYDQWQRIIEAWETGQPGLTIGGYREDGEPMLSRFVGAKSAIHRSSKGYRRSPDYGEWIAHKIDVGFDPQPKRRQILDDGRLEVWPFFSWESVPYKNAMKDDNPEAQLLDEATDVALEQPDSDFLWQ